LVEKLDFKWDEVHEMAEELEHISSTELIDRLDKFMDTPSMTRMATLSPTVTGKFKQQELKTCFGFAVNHAV
jgi:DtxR family Mn-dependent transcriptional regulator